jgi:prolyl oligopeptidase
MDPEARETFVISSQSSILPPSLLLSRAGQQAELLKTAPPRFDADGLTITQHHAASVDGARIQYFQIARGDLALDGSNACLLTGYGGYQISSLPYYSISVGRQWLERGGVYVIANIRGGGEFGPAWHKAGMREGKKQAHDDFAAVAEDLIARGVTRRGRLACSGGSWITEYGDPDKPEDWAFLQEMSAYHHVTPGRDYPPILLTTSSRDDRAHPGHARKMAAKLMAIGYPVYFHEPAEGGHGGATDNRQLAFNTSLLYAFLRKTIAPEMGVIT